MQCTLMIFISLLQILSHLLKTHQSTVCTDDSGHEAHSGYIRCHALKNIGLRYQQQSTVNISPARGGALYLPPPPNIGILPVSSFCRSRAFCYRFCEFTHVSGKYYFLELSILSFAIFPTLLLCGSPSLEGKGWEADRPFRVSILKSLRLIVVISHGRPNPLLIVPKYGSSRSGRRHWVQYQKGKIIKNWQGSKYPLIRH